MLARGLLLPVGLFDAYVASLRLRVVDLGGALYLMLGVSTETVFTQQFLVVYADGDARSG